MIGDTILGFLSSKGVASNFIERYNNRKTAIAFAFLDEKSDVPYSFYKDFSGNRFSKLQYDLEEGDILLFGSFFTIS